MRHDGTAKLAERVKEALERFAKINLHKSLLTKANTTPERVYQALGGKAAGIDVCEADESTIRFTKGCSHTEVVEEYSRLGGRRYKVTQTCVRCREKISSFTRMGGETASRKVVQLPGHILKDEPPTEGVSDSEGGEGGSESEAGGKGQGEAENEGGESQEQKEGDGEGSEGEGEGEEGEGKGDGEDEGPEGDGEADGEGEEGEAEGGEREGDQEGEGDGEGEGEGEEGEDQEGEGSGGQEGEGDADAPPPPPESYVAAFKRHWDEVVPEDVRQRVYRRVSLMLGEEEEGEEGEVFITDQFKVRLDPKTGKTLVG